MKIVLSSDHAGYEINKGLTNYLKTKGYEISNMGPSEYNSKDDYPDFVAPAMKALQKEPGYENSQARAVCLCRNGVGVCVTANKYKGIRAGLCFNKLQTQYARTDDNINVLCLPVDYISDEDILEIVDVFLETEFSALPRHERRIDKIKLLEAENFKA
jgi:ribose 5-phosphate isomerase B